VLAPLLAPGCKCIHWPRHLIASGGAWNLIGGPQWNSHLRPKIRCGCEDWADAQRMKYLCSPDIDLLHQLLTVSSLADSSSTPPSPQDKTKIPLGSHTRTSTMACLYGNMQLRNPLLTPHPVLNLERSAGDMRHDKPYFNDVCSVANSKTRSSFSGRSSTKDPTYPRVGSERRADKARAIVGPRTIVDSHIPWKFNPMFGELVYQPSTDQIIPRTGGRTTVL
jgi:hypothetical protein